MNDEKKKLGASPNDDTSALFVTARKKQLAEQEAQRQAQEEEEKRLAAEAEVRRLEEEVKARKQKAEEETKKLEQEEEERRRQEANGTLKTSSQPVTGKKAVALKAKKGVVITLSVLGVVAIIMIGYIAYVFHAVNSITQNTAEAAYMSVDEYNEMSPSKRKKAVKQMAKVSGKEEFDFEAVDAKLSAMTGKEPGGAFMEAAAVLGVDGAQFIHSGEEFQLWEVLMMKPSDFVFKSVGSQMDTVKVFTDKLIQDSRIPADSNYIKLTGELYDYIMHKLSNEEQEKEGGCFWALCNMMELDGDALLKEYMERPVEEPPAENPEEQPAENPEEQPAPVEEVKDGLVHNGLVYTDTKRNISFTVKEGMSVSRGVSGDELEIANVRMFNNCLVMIDVTEDYNTAMTDGRSKANLLTLCTEQFVNKSFANMYAEPTKLQLVEDKPGASGNECYQTYVVSTPEGKVPVYCELRSMDDKTLFNILFMDEKMEAFDDFVAVVNSISMG